MGCNCDARFKRGAACTLCGAVVASIGAGVVGGSVTITALEVTTALACESVAGAVIGGTLAATGVGLVAVGAVALVGTLFCKNC